MANPNISPIRERSLAEIEAHIRSYENEETQSSSFYASLLLEAQEARAVEAFNALTGEGYVGLEEAPLSRLRDVLTLNREVEEALNASPDAYWVSVARAEERVQILAHWFGRREDEES
jgi:hypothetical protein